MKNSVTVIDTTCRINRGYSQNLYRGKGPMVQDEVQTHTTVEGPALVQAIKRAKRWIASRRFGPGGGGAPRHIALKMAAFHKADPKGFKATLDAHN